MSATPSETGSDPRAPLYRLRLGPDAFAPRYAASWFVALLLWLCAWMPLWLSRAVGAALGYLMLVANRKRREIARINLAMCFPELDDARRAHLLRTHFVRSAQATIDHGFLAWRPRRHILNKVRFTGLENLQTHLGQRNVLLLVPHMVGVDVGGSTLARHCRGFGMIKVQRDPVVNWVLYKSRTRFGAEFFEREQGLRPVLRTVRQGRPLYYLADEDFGPENSVFVPFFGVPAATLTTLGRLAKSADAVVVPVITKLLPGGRGYELLIQPALDNFPSGDAAADAARMNAVLEQGIRLAPEQYLWTFKLFKTRPNNEPSPYPQKEKKHRG
jgi:Kdo2-lipid IVA lauroyltransferase/acyltransferase